MDYKKLLDIDYVDQKLPYNADLVWKPECPEKNGFKIGDIVFHVNKEKQILTEMQIVVEKRYTEYTLTDTCPLFGRFIEYCTPVERVTLKPLNGTWRSGEEYFAMWFNGIMEFPFDLITKSSAKLEEMKKVWRCKFSEADILWDSYNAPFSAQI